MSSQEPSPAAQNDGPPANGEWPSTSWTIIANAPRDSGALAQLYESYWQPLYVYLRRKGDSPERTEDLVQSLFEQVVEGKVIETADPAQKSKFRSFLIGAMNNHRNKALSKDYAKKRGSGVAPLSLDLASAEGFLREVEDQELTPEQACDRIWANVVLDRATEQIRQRFAEKGEGAYFDLIKQFLAWNDGDMSYAEVAKRAGVTVSKIKTDVHRMRSSYRGILRQLVSATLDLSKDVDVEEELRHLAASVG